MKNTYNNPAEMEDKAVGILNDFIDSIGTSPIYTRAPNEDDPFDEDEVRWVFTPKGIALYDRLKRRLQTVCETRFPDNEFEIESEYCLET